MGHYCRICGRSRPNERFSGRGHRRHVCKQCSRMPKQERTAIDEKDELFGFLRQSHISDKNLVRLRHQAQSPDAKTAGYAVLILEVAQVKPHKRRRLKYLARNRRDLLQRLEETGLISAHGW